MESVISALVAEPMLGRTNRVPGRHLVCWQMQGCAPIDDCHFGYFDLTQLRKAYKILLESKDQELKYDNNGNIVN